MQTLKITTCQAPVTNTHYNPIRHMATLAADVHLN
jgi:hypothetical protein